MSFDVNVNNFDEVAAQWGYAIIDDEQRVLHEGKFRSVEDTHRALTSVAAKTAEPYWLGQLPEIRRLPDMAAFDRAVEQDVFAPLKVIGAAIERIVALENPVAFIQQSPMLNPDTGSFGHLAPLWNKRAQALVTTTQLVDALVSPSNARHMAEIERIERIQSDPTRIINDPTARKKLLKELQSEGLDVERTDEPRLRQMYGVVTYELWNIREARKANTQTAAPIETGLVSGLLSVIIAAETTLTVLVTAAPAVGVLAYFAAKAGNAVNNRQPSERAQSETTLIKVQANIDDELSRRLAPECDAPQPEVPPRLFDAVALSGERRTQPTLSF